MNYHAFIGRLTRDPEVRETQNGTKVARFDLAVDRPKRNGESTGTDFPHIVVWGKQAENCERFLKKGSLVCVEARFQSGSYKNDEGRTVYTADFVANRVEFLSWNGNKESEENVSAEELAVPEGFEEVTDEQIPF